MSGEKFPAKGLKEDLATLRKRFDDIEASQSFLSTKYDTVLATIQGVKMQAETTERRIKGIEADVEKGRDESYDLVIRLDELEQYSRRDSLEITGIPIVPNDDPAKLVVEMASLVDVQLDESDISVAHRLPPTKKVQDRLIVKFARRTKRDEIYKKRGKLRTKRTKDLPTVRAQPESSAISHKAAIHVNESLTPYRKRLFGRILEFKRDNNYKYLWTANGRIMLRETDTSRALCFVTYETFEEYLDYLAQT